MNFQWCLSSQTRLLVETEATVLQVQEVVCEDQRRQPQAAREGRDGEAHGGSPPGLHGGHGGPGGIRGQGQGQGQVRGHGEGQRGAGRDAGERVVHRVPGRAVQSAGVCDTGDEAGMFYRIFLLGGY